MPRPLNGRYLKLKFSVDLEELDNTYNRLRGSLTQAVDLANKYEELIHTTDEEEIEKLKEEIKDLEDSKSSLRSLLDESITPYEFKQIMKWYYHHLNIKANKEKNFNVQNHKLSWDIEWTGLGLVRWATCSCGEHLDLSGDM